MDDGRPTKSFPFVKYNYQFLRGRLHEFFIFFTALNYPEWVHLETIKLM